MNINSIKALTWLISAGLTAGVSYYVWDFQQNEAEILKDRLSAEQTKEILDSAEIPEGPISSLVSSNAIERSYYYDLKNKSLPNLLDWTGAPPREVVVVQPKETEPQAPVHKKIADALTVSLVQQSMASPERSKAWIKYKPESGVPAAGDAFPTVITVGETLPSPLDYATVKAIHADDGITFEFDEEGREDEVVTYRTFDAGVEIYVVGSDQPEIVATPQDVPVVDRNTFRPDKTVLLGDNQFLIGTENMQDFSDDFAGIIAREVRHSRHYNAKLGKYDGIELKEVKPGGQIASHGGQSGDIIKSINGHAVTSSSEAITFVKNNKDKYSKWIVIVENKGKERTMTFESPPEE